MISATDPVAVVAVMKEQGVSRKLAMVVEGESLLNDGTAMVGFLVVLVSDHGPIIYRQLLRKEG